MEVRRVVPPRSRAGTLAAGVLATLGVLTGLWGFAPSIARANDEATLPGPDAITFAPNLAGDTLNLFERQNTLAGPSAFLVSSAITIEGIAPRRDATNRP